MSTITQKERKLSILGVEGRAFAVVTAENGCILNQRIATTRYYEKEKYQYRITVTLCFDDKCRNGHETFTITADIREDGREYMGGCCHEEIIKRFPEFMPLIKWHLCSTDGPIHYPSNVLYHALEHGATHAWIYYTGQVDPCGIGGGEERLLGYFKKNKTREVENVKGYRVEWDKKTIKLADIEHARTSAVWPEATLTQLRDKVQLLARLPKLLTDFQEAMLSIGFVWPHKEVCEA